MIAQPQRTAPSQNLWVDVLRYVTKILRNIFRLKSSSKVKQRHYFEGYSNMEIRKRFGFPMGFQMFIIQIRLKQMHKPFKNQAAGFKNHLECKKEFRGLLQVLISESSTPK